MLPPATCLGPYEIIGPLGQGGMGEVYRAHDTRLDRIVALKTLLPTPDPDGERRARFEREARTLAALSHPHICPIFDIGEAVPLDGASGDRDASPAGTPLQYLVMEYLEGETLAARLTRGRLPLAEALRHGLEIISGLEAAHRRGVIHRDLKPGNIMLTTSGAKLVDFGLARLCPPGIGLEGADARPTATGPLTRRGTILGTLHYLPPEQLNGRPADERSDLFAFGAVLYEMVTGRRAFEAGSAAGVISAILSTEPPPLASIDPLSPAALDHLVTGCLAKDPDQRWQSATDVKLQLEWIAETADAPSASSSSAGPRSATGWKMATAALAVALLAAVAVPGPGSSWFGAAADTAPAVTRYVVNLSGEQQLAFQMSVFTPSLALSADGRLLVHVGRADGGDTQLYIRRLDQFQSVALPGTDGAYTPFFSPDGAWVGFFQHGELRRISTSGGRPVTICAASSQGLGADWLQDDTIVFSPGIGSGLMRVPAGGGTPEVVTVPDRAQGEVTHAYPQVLPNGRDILFGVQTPPAFEVAVFSAETRAWRTLTDGRSSRYLPTGHLLFARGDTLWAAPFDAEALALRGEPEPVVDRVRPISIAGGDYAVSDTGLLVYVSGARANPRTELRWADRDGTRTPLAGDAATYATPRVSPDGQRLAFSIYPPGGDGSSIWISDWQTERRTRLSVEGNIQLYPVWTSDGTRLTFTAPRPDTRLHWQRADGIGSVDPLLTSSVPQIAGTWSPDGLVYVNVAPTTFEDIWVLRLGGDPQPLVATTARETSPSLSRDGHWLTYASDESGRHEVYVARYPEMDRRTVVSTGGGREPVWSPMGGELFYLDERDWIVAVPMADGGPAGAARPLFETSSIPDRFLVRTYDVTPDARRFILAEPIEAIQLDRVHVVEHWFEELRRRVPNS